MKRPILFCLLLALANGSSSQASVRPRSAWS